MNQISGVGPVPLFIAYSVFDISVQVTLSIKLYQNNFKLIGIIYFGNFHFTSRIIDYSGNIWFNDSLETGQQCKWKDNINCVDPALLSKNKGRKIAMVIYIKVD